MERVEDSASLLSWLGDRPGEEAVTGYDPAGWEASTWILHAMYQNDGLLGLGTHDELHRRRLDAGDIAPVIVGDVNLDEGATVTGTPLGFLVRPGTPWRRVLWSEYLAGLSDTAPERTVPPSDRWFPHRSWSVAVEPPPEGSLDEESLEALLATLTSHSVNGATTECVAFYASLPAADFDTPHAWRGELSAIPSLLEERGGPYSFSPTNLWPVDRSWFVLTDYDLEGTKVSGPATLIEAIKAHPDLETVDWPEQAP